MNEMPKLWFPVTMPFVADFTDLTVRTRGAELYIDGSRSIVQPSLEYSEFFFSGHHSIHIIPLDETYIDQRQSGRGAESVLFEYWRYWVSNPAIIQFYSSRVYQVGGDIMPSHNLQVARMKEPLIPEDTFLLRSQAVPPHTGAGGSFHEFTGFAINRLTAKNILSSAAPNKALRIDWTWDEELGQFISGSGTDFTTQGLAAISLQLTDYDVPDLKLEITFSALPTRGHGPVSLHLVPPRIVRSIERRAWNIIQLSTSTPECLTPAVCSWYILKHISLPTYYG